MRTLLPGLNHPRKNSLVGKLTSTALHRGAPPERAKRKGPAIGGDCQEGDRGDEWCGKGEEETAGGCQ